MVYLGHVFIIYQLFSTSKFDSIASLTLNYCNMGGSIITLVWSACLYDMRIYIYLSLHVSLGTIVVQGATLETLSWSGWGLTEEKKKAERRENYHFSEQTGNGRVKNSVTCVKSFAESYTGKVDWIWLLITTFFPDYYKMREEFVLW